MKQFSDDPIKRFVEKDVDNELSPMDPPDAFSPPGLDPVPRAEMSPFLQKLMDDHSELTGKLDAFEGVLSAIAENGASKEADAGLRDFFEAFDEQFIRHEQNEERELFPELARMLLERGEHGQGPEPLTSVDLMRNDHLKAIQLAAVVFNFFGLSVRLPDPKSRLIVLDAALEQGKVLVEMLRLHMFREDNIIFPLAHKHIERATLDGMKRE